MPVKGEPRNAKSLQVKRNRAALHTPKTPSRPAGQFSAVGWLNFVGVGIWASVSTLGWNWFRLNIQFNIERVVGKLRCRAGQIKPILEKIPGAAQVEFETEGRTPQLQI